MLLPLAKGISVLMPDAPNFYPYCICMYIEGEQRAIVDFGAGIKAFEEIDKRSVDIGILTHNHPDHTHCGVLFDDTRLYAAKEEEGSYTIEQEYLNLRGFNLWKEIMKEKPLPANDGFPTNPDIPVGPGFVKLHLTGTFTDRKQFDLGRGMKLTAVHLPGHCIGHYGVYVEKEGILFSGDIDTTRGGPWYGDGTSNVGQFIRSVQLIKEIDPHVLASSHRRPLTENIKQSLDTYLQIMLDREQQIYDLLSKPHTIEEMAEYRLAFKKRIFHMEDFWERLYMHHHIQHLMEIGAVVEIESGIFQQV
ncbi:putative dehydrase [hydrocarbon metagenome]|uniref:Putative dehydrase n=1 Tax=hydrocarbon metagenome TaxID=938273 RepID=A0A0W8E535_9ZZZZ